MIASGEGWLVHSVDSLLAGIAGVERYWLHPAELAQFHRFRNEDRRKSWIGGRVAAKQLLLSQLSSEVRCPREIEISSRGSNRLGYPPVARFSDGSPPLPLSISHTGRIVSAAISPDRKTRTGIDVVELAEADQQHLAPWLASCELEWLHSRHDLFAVELWAAKEAAFKTLPRGVPFRPRRCIVNPTHGSVWSFITREKDLRFTGCVRIWRSQECAIALATRRLAESAGQRDFETNC